MNMTTEHIPIDQLVELATNRMTREDSLRTRVHLANCPQCTSSFTSINTGTSSSSEIERNAATHVVAVLSFDSRQLSPAFGVRSGRSVARQLLFSIGENDLDLRVTPDDGEWVVSGQVLGQCNGGQVELRGHDITEHTSMNELCEFYLPRVPPGSYSLRVYISQLEIEVPEFELRA
jgi:hypothetical protein